MKRCVLVFLSLLLVMYLLEVLWEVPEEAGFKTRLSASYYTQVFHVRSPLRAVSEAVHFMPHSSVNHWGQDYAYKNYLCKQEHRIVRILGGARSAAVLADESLYAYLTAKSPTKLRVVRTDRKQLLLERDVLELKSVALGRAMLSWKDPHHIAIHEYIVENSAVQPPRWVAEVYVEYNAH